MGVSAALSAKENKVQIRNAIANDIPAIQSLYRELDSHHVGILAQYFQNVEGDIRTDESIIAFARSRHAWS